MKRVLLIIAALVLLLQAGPMLAASGRVTDATKSLSVAIPSGWTQSKVEVFGSKLILVGPKHDDFSTSINLMTEKIGKLSLADYCKITEKNSPKILKAFKIISRRATKLGGIAAFEYVYSGVTGVRDMKTKFKCAMAIKKGTAYVITYTSPTPYYNEDVAAFDSVRKSLKWLK